MNGSELLAAAVAACPSLRAENEQASKSLTTLLVDAVDEATHVWPALDVDAREFIRFAAERLPENARAEDLAKLCFPDLYLACACLRGQEKAVRGFADKYLDELGGLTKDVKPTAEELRELRSDLSHKLFVASAEERAPKLAEYSGRGALTSWLRIVASREILAKRRKKVHEQPEDDAFFTRLQAAGVSPELLHLEKQYAEEFRAALAAALAALTSRARNLLRYRYREELSVDQIGAIYSVHRATAARWVKEAESSVRAQVCQALREKLQVAQSELESMMALLDSHIEVSLRWTISEVEEEKSTAPSSNRRFR